MGPFPRTAHAHTHTHTPQLAHERLEGDASFYAPYIDSLPDALPCAWALPTEDLESRLATLLPRIGREGVDAWHAQVRVDVTLMPL
jgi:hypothetical protein